MQRYGGWERPGVGQQCPPAPPTHTLLDSQGDEGGGGEAGQGKINNQPQKQHEEDGQTSSLCNPLDGQGDEECGHQVGEGEVEVVERAARALGALGIGRMAVAG